MKARGNIEIIAFLYGVYLIMIRLSLGLEASSLRECVFADVNQARIDELLASDREALKRLIAKED